MWTLVKPLLFMLASAALLADVVFIFWATKLNLLIVVPAVLSACYLSYVAAHYTILDEDEEDKSNDLGVGVQKARRSVHEFGGESSTGGTRPITENGGDLAYARAATD